jgi:hypothetical protein
MMAGVVANQMRRASGAGDSHFSSVSLLLHMDGSSGSTTFVDKSPLALAVTPAGSADVSSAQSLFGGGSLNVPAVADYLSVANNAALNFDAGDFSIEIAAYFKAAPSSAGEYLFSKWSTAGATDEYTFYATNTALAFSFRSTGGGDFRTCSGGFTFAAGQWYQLAVKRSGDLFSVWVDGSQVGSTTLSFTLNSSSTPPTVGRINGSTAYGCNAYLDELRVTKGIARSFSIQTSAFPDS